MKFFFKTYRYEHHGKENLDLAKSRSECNSFLYAGWHGDSAALLGGVAWTEPYLVMASRSKDGDYAAFVAEKAGLIPVRGSSKKKGKDKGGKEALSIFVEQLRQGKSGGLTIDGPKGPYHVCKPGIALMAKESGAPIVPIYAIANSYWEFTSWDRFKLPKPFAKIRMTYGEPILVAKDSTPEQINEVCRLVEKRLMVLEQSRQF